MSSLLSGGGTRWPAGKAKLSQHRRVPSRSLQLDSRKQPATNRHCVTLCPANGNVVLGFFRERSILWLGFVWQAVLFAKWTEQHKNCERRVREFSALEINTSNCFIRSADQNTTRKNTELFQLYNKLKKQCIIISSSRRRRIFIIHIVIHIIIIIKYYYCELGL